MHSSRIIISILVTIMVLVASVWLGVGVASNQAQTLMIGGGVIALGICVSLGQRIWLLFLFLFSMEIPFVRGLTTMEVGYFIFAGFSLLAFLMRRLNLHHNITELDFWRVLVAMTILQVYIRNPVGLNLFGAGQVGGRPYFIAVSAFIAAVALSKYRVPAADLKLSRWVAIAAAIVMFPINTLRYGLGRGPDLSNVQVVEGMETGGAGRDGKYERMARILSSILVSKISPLRAAFHPVWVFFVLLVLGMAAVSGYRNSVAYVGLILLVGIAYYNGRMGIFLSTVLGCLALGALALLNIAYPLPPNAQRALSPFPGSWEERYVEAGDRSTEWRIEMWKAALFTDEYIDNKLIGDGLGMSRAEMERMLDIATRKRSSRDSELTVQQESMMVTGSYHSGPVQTIRTTGYFGLIILLVALIRMCVHTHRQIRRCWGTPWQSTMLFFGVPIIAFPFFFTFIFGTFQTAISFFFINSALIDLFKNNLPLPAYVPQSRKVYTPMTWRNREKPSPDPIPAFSSKN